MRLLSSAEVAEATGLHIDTVRLHLRTGRLPARRIGRVYLVDEREMKRWVATKPKRGRPRKGTKG